MTTTADPIADILELFKEHRNASRSEHHAIAAPSLDAVASAVEKHGFRVIRGIDAPGIENRFLGVPIYYDPLLPPDVIELRPLRWIYDSLATPARWNP